MGSSPTAKLYYGFPLDEDPGRIRSEGAEELFLEAAGFNEKAPPMPKPWDRNSPEGQQWLADYEAYRQRLKAAIDSLGGGNVTSDYYGTGSYTGILLALESPKYTADWADSEPLTAAHLEVKPEWREWFVKAAQILNVKFEEPQWFLAARYG